LKNKKQINETENFDETLVHGRFKLLKKIGSGAEGDVFKVEDTQDNEMKLYFLLNFIYLKIEIKLFKLYNYSKALKEIDPRIDNKLVEQEISILKKVQHENIIKYLDFFTGKLFLLVFIK